MKFAKELEQDLVPEWRIKYLDYKTGKKQVKAVAKAVNRAQGTPRTPRMPGFNRNTSFRDSPFFRALGNSPLNPSKGTSKRNEQTAPLRRSPAALGRDSRPDSGGSSSGDQVEVTTPMLIPDKNRRNKRVEPPIQYGSFVATPPSNPPQFELPDPALDSPAEGLSPMTKSPLDERMSKETERPRHVQRSASLSVPGSAYEAGQTNPPPKKHTLSERIKHPLPRHMSAAVTSSNSKHRPFMQRMLSNASPLSQNTSKDTDLSVIDQVRARQKDFFGWMDNELDKIETFYKSKEDEAGDRLIILREQLHEMRNRRIEEIAHAKREREIRKEDTHTALGALGIDDSGKPSRLSHDSNGRPGTREQVHAWIRPFERALETAKSQTMGPRPGANSQALINMGLTVDQPGRVSEHHNSTDPGRDYVRKPHYEHEVPYRTAKRKLKLAMKEFYRGLELLKSYALLNRTAFRKINKKYDKAVNAHPPLRYMSEKVNKAWFVNSDVLDGHLHAVEDMYARYFERGNHKIAVGKLRSSSGRPGHYTGSIFRTGVLIGIGAVLAVQGLIYGSEILLHNADASIRTQASYLLQIYGGYFLALYLFTLFTLNCEIWNRNKINYVFIFEFDPRHHLDWRELAEFPAFFIFLLGFFIWLNFSDLGTPAMFLYYPAVLMFVTALIIFIPAPILLHRSREWFVYSHWRLLLAGLYPVEFRDFFLGDMFCSLTYLMSNLELFFCLYAVKWNTPAQCNSTHSRLLGFFSALPGIWRALQCLRRYYDTRSKFPHLANCGKYSMTIMYYISLSLYRIQRHPALLANFITFAAINAVYCSVWDLAMDWSLLQPHAKRPFLRDVRAYKHAWYYYAAMVIDVMLRFNWVFYIIYTHDLQHNSIASFLIAFSEVTRRGMWTLFRVENEHCANVMRFKASRDVPLPYPIPDGPTTPFTRPHSEPSSPGIPTISQTTSSSRHGRSNTTAAEAGQSPRPGLENTLRRRLTRVFAEAHTQDFEKKRKPGAGDVDNSTSLHRDKSVDEEDEVAKNSSDEEDDDEDIGDEGDVLSIGGSRRRRHNSDESDNS